MKKIIKLQKKRQVIDLTGQKKKRAPRREIIDLTRDDEKISEIERDEKEVDYYFEESAQQRADQIEKMDRKVLKADPQTNNISKKRRHLLFLNVGDGVLQRAHELFKQPTFASVGRPVCKTFAV